MPATVPPVTPRWFAEPLVKVALISSFTSVLVVTIPLLLKMEKTDKKVEVVQKATDEVHVLVNAAATTADSTNRAKDRIIQQKDSTIARMIELMGEQRAP